MQGYRCEQAIKNTLNTAWSIVKFTLLQQFLPLVSNKALRWQKTSWPQNAVAQGATDDSD